MNRIGVAVPTWNAGVTLPWTLLSLQHQEGCTVDVVVADSASTDNTLSLCNAAGVRTLYEPPGNLYRAVNAGLRTFDSPWLTYLNADDAVYTDAYATLIEAGERSGADIVYGDCDYVDWHGRFLFALRAAPSRLLGGMYSAGLMPFNQPCAVFRRQLFERLGGFDEEFRQIADFVFFSRAARSGAQFEQVPGFPVVAFRLHAAQLSARGHPLNREELALFESRQPAGAGLASRLAVWRWRLANAGQYFSRRLRTGHWGGRPPKVGAVAAQSGGSPLASTPAEQSGVNQGGSR